MTYLYIAAYRELSDRDEGLLISFRHVKIEADSKEDAYTLGWRELPTLFRFVNDYVVKID